MSQLRQNSFGVASGGLTILSGAALSETLQLDGRALVGIFMPAAWTAASLTFQASLDGTTWANYYIRVDNTTLSELTITTPAASVFVAVDPTLFAGVTYLRIRSGTSGTPVNQGADRVLTTILRDVRGR